MRQGSAEVRISVHMAMLAAVHLVVAFLVPPPALLRLRGRRGARCFE